VNQKKTDSLTLPNNTYKYGLISTILDKSYTESPLTSLTELQTLRVDSVGLHYRRRTCFVVIWKHFCFILSTGTRIRIDSVMRPRSSSRGAIQVPQLQLQLQDVRFLFTCWYSLFYGSNFPTTEKLTESIYLHAIYAGL